MKRLLMVLFLAVPGLSSAQPLLDLRNDYAFDAKTVEAAAAGAYRARLKSFAADGRLDADARLLGRLRALVAGLNLAATLERPGATPFVWEVHTCRRCAENASAMAGGRILVGEEFIADLALDDQELGYLLAHEMGHVLAEHTREFASVARYFVDNGRNRDYGDIQGELDQSLVVNLRMATVGVQQELEADYIGFILGARSGHDPEAMLRLLRKLQAAGTSAFAMHPAPDRRLARAQATLQSAHRIRAIGVAARQGID